MLVFGITVVIAGVLLLVLISILSRPAKLDKKYYETKWQEIEKLLDGGYSDWYKAVIDADKLLDHALKAAGFQGKTMGDRLKDAKRLRSINSAWAAHKLRNKLVHDSDIKLKKKYASAALRSYRAILKDLRAL